MNCVVLSVGVSWPHGSARMLARPCSMIAGHGCISVMQMAAKFMFAVNL